MNKNTSLSLLPPTTEEIHKCVLNKIEHIIKNKINKNLGFGLINNSILELSPFQGVQFSSWNIWEQDPLKNRSWQWRLNWLSFLSYLMAYHHETREEAILDMGKEAIDSWLRTYLKTDPSYGFEFIWHDHATALRAEQLVLFSYYCKIYDSNWSRKNAYFFEYLEYGLQVHGEWLSKDSFYSEYTNHGLEQARVLLLLSSVFDGIKAIEWQNIALHRISKELKFAFTNEGVHVENSPAYHIFVFKVFLNIIKEYPAEILGDLSTEFDLFSVKALEFITHILRPDGLLPPIGDTEQLSTSDSYYEAFGHTLEYENFIYALSAGLKGVAPKLNNKVYPKSGYAIFRDEWFSNTNFNKSLQIAVKVGCSSRYHHQQDEGHINLYAGGEDWLIDSGLYNYIPTDPIRKYMRSRAAHNVPIITHTNYSNDFEHRLRSWQVTNYSEDQIKPFIEMKLEVLIPVIHYRTVGLNSITKITTVQDKISADDEQVRNITLTWHIPKNKKIVIKNNSHITIESSSGNKLIINLSNDKPDKVLITEGQKNNKVLSCISYKTNKFEASQLLQLIYLDRTKLDTKTSFEFHQKR